MSEDFTDFVDHGLYDPEPCAYLPEKMRRDMGARIKPSVEIPDRIELAEGLLAAGFSYAAASTFYTPLCVACDVCVPIRYPLEDFRMSPPQQKLWRMLPLRQVFAYHGYQSVPHYEEHVALLKAHIAARYPHEEARESSEKRLLQPFRLQPVLPIRIVEMRDQDNVLLAGSLSLETVNSLYAIFYYYDPALMHLQPGKQIILTLLHHAREIGKDHLYVGAWNRECGSLAMKTQFKPYELYRQGSWQRPALTRP
jgi:arginine-tRNA-protein transferase